MELIHTLFYFVVAIGILVSFHEFGHFWVARKVGVKVIRFSVGFGKVLWSYQKNSEATEYVISAIPLGGYVKMIDEREGEVSTDDLPYAFNRQSLWARTAIVAAGPIFNLFLAVILFWSVLVIGEVGIKPILGEVKQNTIAYKAGFTEGDEIVSINDKLSPTWSEALSGIISSALEGNHEIKVLIKHGDEAAVEKILNFTDVDIKSPEELYQQLGFKPWSPKLKPIIGKVLPEGAALEAGLEQGDVVISADGIALKEWLQLVDIVKKKPGETIELQIERDAVQLKIDITPKTIQVEHGAEGKIGASVYVPESLQKSMQIEYALPPLEAVPVALENTLFYSISTLKMLAKMFIGEASVENLSGPISIAQYAGQSANMGFAAFFKFMAFVSVSLGVLNLLPVPVLDGGHLLFFAIEGLRGRPVSERIQLFFQQVGMSFLFLLMAVAMTMDVKRSILNTSFFQSMKEVFKSLFY